MRAANSVLVLLGAVAALAACHRDTTDQNLLISNDVPPDAEMETLPPDESSATPTNQLANGEDQPDVDDLDSNSN